VPSTPPMSKKTCETEGIVWGTVTEPRKYISFDRSQPIHSPGAPEMNAVRRIAPVAVAITIVPASLWSQDRLKDMPGAAQYQRMSQVMVQVAQQVSASRVTGITWTEGGKGLDYSVGGKAYHFDFATKRAVETPPGSASA